MAMWHLHTLTIGRPATAAAIVCAISSSGYANIIVSTTRAIVPVPPGHTSVRLTNKSAVPALVQVWADSGDGASTPDTSDAPFEITPALFVLGANESQVIRIDYDDDPTKPLPAHRESLYWLNVLDIPSTSERPSDNTAVDPSTRDSSKASSTELGDQTQAQPTARGAPQSDENAIRFVVHTRIKLIARPRGLEGSALYAPGKVVWHIEQAGDVDTSNDAESAASVNSAGRAPASTPSARHPASISRATKLIGMNTTPFYVTCAPLFVTAADKRERKLGTRAIAPGESVEFDLGAKDKTHVNAHSPLEESPNTAWTETVCHAINDFGSIDVFRSRLDGAPSSGED